MGEYSESKQMYLKTISELEQTVQKVRCIDIAKSLNFSRPSVTNAVKKLRYDGLVSTKIDGQIELTEKGRRTANELCERSKILTNFFVSLGADDKLANETAHKIEYFLNDEILEIIKKSTV